MTYELLASDPKSGKTNKKKGDAMKIQVTDITKMSLGQIVWFIVKKHKMLLMTTYATIVTTMYIVQGLPIALHHVFSK